MRAKAIIGGLVLAAGFATSATGNQYLARNGMWAASNPERAGYFEVFRRAHARPSDYWCAAGEFVRWGIREGNTTRIYVVRGPAPSRISPGRTSVLYSTVRYDDIPDLSDAEKGYSVSVTKKGYHLSAGHGTAFCLKSVRRFRSFGLW